MMTFWMNLWRLCRTGMIISAFVSSFAHFLYPVCFVILIQTSHVACKINMLSSLTLSVHAAKSCGIQSQSKVTYSLNGSIGLLKSDQRALAAIGAIDFIGMALSRQMVKGTPNFQQLNYIFMFLTIGNIHVKLFTLELSTMIWLSH